MYKTIPYNGMMAVMRCYALNGLTARKEKRIILTAQSDRRYEFFHVLGLASGREGRVYLTRKE